MVYMITLNSFTKTMERIRIIHEICVDLEKEGRVKVNSDEIGKLFSQYSDAALKGATIRGILNTFGEYGQQGYGYSVNYLKKMTEKIPRLYKEVAIIGADQFVPYFDNTQSGYGSCKYYAKYIFENDSNLIGKNYCGLPVRDISELPKYMKSLKDKANNDYSDGADCIALILRDGIIDEEEYEAYGIEEIVSYTHEIMDGNTPTIALISDPDEYIIYHMRGRNLISKEEKDVLIKYHYQFSGEVRKQYKDKKTVSPFEAIISSADIVLNEAKAKEEEQRNNADEVTLYCLDNYEAPSAYSDINKCTTNLIYADSQKPVPNYVKDCVIQELIKSRTATISAKAKYLIDKIDEESLKLFVFKAFIPKGYSYELLDSHYNRLLVAQCRKYDPSNLEARGLLPLLCQYIKGDEINNLVLDKRIWELSRNINLEEYLVNNDSRETMAYLCSSWSGSYLNDSDNMTKYVDYHKISETEIRECLATPVQGFFLNKEEKIKYCVNLAKRLNGLLCSADYRREYNDFITTDGINRFKKRDDSDIEGAYEFLSAVASSETAEGIYQNCFKEVLEGTLSWYKGYGTISIPTPIVIAIALQNFVDPEASSECEFARDKWEYRGDYTGLYSLNFEMSTAFPKGWIDIYNRDPKTTKYEM